MTRPPLELLADWIEAEAACNGAYEDSIWAVVTRSRLITLDPTALRAQVETEARVQGAFRQLHEYFSGLANAHPREADQWQHAARMVQAAMTPANGGE